jgi:hypothetical protein
LIAIVAVGILSRVFHTGFVVLDKYLGDALYAVMVYAMLRLVRRGGAVAIPAMAVMTAIELFQLTMIPAHMLHSPHLFTRLCARLIGAEFSFRDLLAYAVGISIIWLFDASRAGGPGNPLRAADAMADADRRL